MPPEDADPDDDGSGVAAPDPTRDLPSPSAQVPDPSDAVPDPQTPETEAADVPTDLWVSFWYLVVVFNAAVLAFGVGLLLVTLGDDPELGGRLLFAGGVLGLYGYYRYRRNPYRDGVDAETER